MIKSKIKIRFFINHQFIEFSQIFAPLFRTNGVNKIKIQNHGTNLKYTNLSLLHISVKLKGNSTKKWNL